MRTRRRRQARARDFGKVDAGLLEHRALLEHARAPTADQRGRGLAVVTVRVASPRVFDEAPLAIGGLECRADAVLQIEQPRAHRVDA